MVHVGGSQIRRTAFVKRPGGWRWRWRSRRAPWYAPRWLTQTRRLRFWRSMSSLRRPLPSGSVLLLFYFCFSLFFGFPQQTRFIGLVTKATGVSACKRCEAGPAAAPKPMAPDNDATLLWRHAVDRRFGAAVDNTRRCRHPIPASLLRLLPFLRFYSCPSYSDGLSRVRPPSSSREVGTLSDSALEPSSRRPAPRQLFC